MLRYQVVVADQPTAIPLNSDPLHVEAVPFGMEGPHVVELWAEDDADTAHVVRYFQVFGTGHPIPDAAKWWGTTARTDQGLVWHLYELLEVP
jgi:hypothetical protein